MTCSKLHWELPRTFRRRRSRDLNARSSHCPIRQRARHKDTPVVFVTGMSGPEMRAKSTLCGGNDFLAKPFVLTELALKALMMIVRTELRTAVYVVPIAYLILLVPFESLDVSLEEASFIAGALKRPVS